MQRFSRRTILVTGASSGIGAATAMRLADEGASIVLWARRLKELSQVASSLSGEGHSSNAIDVTNEASVAESISSLKASGVVLDGMVLAAGAHAVRPLMMETPEKLASVFDVNVGSLFRVIRLSLRAGLVGSPASIVALSSQAALIGAGGASAYAASKGAVESAVKSWAVELASKSIRINAVAPGVVETPMTEKFFRFLTADQQAEIKRRHLLGLGSDRDVAAAISFLLSDDARWITGTILRADGGYALG